MHKLPTGDAVISEPLQSAEAILYSQSEDVVLVCIQATLLGSRRANYSMKQSTDHMPQPVLNAGINVWNVVRAAIIFIAWLALVPFLVMIMCVVLATWR